MKNIFLVLLLTMFGSVLSVSAEQIPATGTEAITSAFQKYKDVSAPEVKVPIVVEVPFLEDFANRFNFAVLDIETGTFQPYYFTEQLRAARTPMFVSVQGEVMGKEMIDGDIRTFTEFTLPQNEQGQTRLVLTSAKPVTLSGMTFFLDQFVALPTSIEIRANTDDGEKIILARSRMYRSSVVFPKTTAKEWVISFTYGQMLRITEIVLNDESAGTTSSRSLRFLAQPEHHYRIYFDADRSVSVSVGESANLVSDTEVLRFANIPSQVNAGYVVADTDGDGIPDVHDNCVSTPNSDQVDVNGNGRGDACDDFDKDGIVNMGDNCPNDPNRNQSDVDGDNIGDTCDTEESRVTEKYPWLPWVGMGFAGLVLMVLFALTARGMIKNDSAGKENQE